MRQHDPDEAEDGRLRDDAREQRRDLGRRLGVRGAQPAVERQQRRLHRERDGEAEEDPVVAARAGVDEAERALREAERDDRGEHQQRAGHRVDHERDRRADPVRAAPDADEHVDRDQHRLEEDVEEEQVLRGEDADDRTDEEQHQPVVGARPLAAGPDAEADRGGAEHDGQPGEPEREAVEADVVGDAEVVEPFPLGRVLQRRRVEVEGEQRDDPQRDLGERGEEREARRRLARQRRDPDHERGDERQQDQQRRQHQRTATKTITRTTTEAAIASA